MAHRYNNSNKTLFPVDVDPSIRHLKRKDLVKKILELDSDLMSIELGVAGKLLVAFGSATENEVELENKEQVVKDFMMPQIYQQYRRVELMWMVMGLRKEIQKREKQTADMIAMAHEIIREQKAKAAETRKRSVDDVERTGKKCKSAKGE